MAGRGALVLLGLASAPEPARGLAGSVLRQTWMDTQSPGYLEGCQGYQCVERYISMADSSYTWRELPDEMLSGELQGVPWTGHVLSMVSQKWLSSRDTDHQTWSHPMVVVVPGNIDQSPSKARQWSTLVVGGANLVTQNFTRGVSAEFPDVQAAIFMATQTGAIAAAVMQCPNQPFAFGSDPERRERTEDQIKAYTWRHVEEDPASKEWPIELPNAKAAVRAMDAVASFANTLGYAVTSFGLSGCSKRANAAMMACAYDSRCELLMPCAMTADTDAYFHHMMQSLGNPVAADQDYFKEGIMAMDGRPEMAELMDIVDSKSYMSRLTMPKLWLNCAADDFFLPDHTEKFWHTVPSPRYLYQKENARHAGNLDTTNFLEPAAAFTSAFLLEQTLPVIDWSIDNATGEITARRWSGPEPLTVSLWTARTCGATGRRDLRQFTLDAGPFCAACGQPDRSAPGLCNVARSTAWTKRSELDAGAGQWRVQGETPSRGWEAFYIAFEFAPATATGPNLRFSTEVSMVPRTMPFPDCHGESCAGTRLV